MKDDKSTVVEETEEERVEDSAAPEAPDAQEENLDDLLKEFEGGEESTAEQTEETEPDVKTLAQKIKELEEREHRQAFEQEMASLAGEVRGDLPSDVFEDEFVQSYLDAKARKDPRLAKAFMNRHNAPSAWKAVVRGVAKEFQGKFASLPDRQATEDADAVENAVRSASTKAPEQDDELTHEKARHMTNDQLEEALKKYSK